MFCGGGGRTLSMFAGITILWLTLALVVTTVDAQTPAPTGVTAPALDPLVKIPVSACLEKGSNYIFDVAALACSTCPAGSVPNDEATACVCPATSRTAGRTGPLTCVDCSAQNLDVSMDGMVCMSCQSPATFDAATPVASTTASGTPAPGTPAPGTPAVFNASDAVVAAQCAGAIRGAAQVKSSGQASVGSLGSITCTCPTGYAISDVGATGARSTGGKLCFLCPYSSYVDVGTPGICTPCPDPLMSRSPTTGKCVCPAGLVEDSVLIAGSTVTDIPVVGKHVCLDQTLATSVGFTAMEYGKQTFKNVIDVDGSRTESNNVEKSEPFLTHFLEAAVRCKDSRRWESCQTLANLCTLALHDQNSPACKVLESYTRTVITDVHDFPGMYIHTYAHAYVHTYIHTYIHTYEKHTH
jgi:hypothetical protein